MKHEESFKVDAPICISGEVALTVDVISLLRKINDELLLQLSAVGQVPRNYKAKALLCARPKLLRLHDNGEVAKFNSKQDTNIQLTAGVRAEND